jgi:predicted aspartyl protease
VNSGQFHGGFPHLELMLPLSQGGHKSIEFIVDTGFEADIALSPVLLMGIDASYVGEFPFALADFTYRTRPVYSVLVEWQGEPRVAEIVAFEGNPLVGVGLLRGCLLEMEMEEGGEISISPI